MAPRLAELWAPLTVAQTTTHLLKAAKRLFGIPDFRLYALADGIRDVCVRSPRRARHGAKDPPQLTLGFG